MCKMKKTGVADADAAVKCKRSADIRALERCEMLELRFQVSALALLSFKPRLGFKQEGLEVTRVCGVLGAWLGLAPRATSFPLTINRYSEY